jgi:hypothetical protein
MIHGNLRVCVGQCVDAYRAMWRVVNCVYYTTTLLAIAHNKKERKLKKKKMH